MGQLIGFGSPLVTTIWAISFVGALVWLFHELIRRRMVSLLSTTVVFMFFLPVILQYPFAFSPFNSLVVGLENYNRYRSHVDQAFLITLAGMAMLVVGYVACGSRGADYAPVKFVAAGLRVWTQGVFLQLASGLILVLFALMAAVGLIGAGGARSLAQSVPALRPLYNVAHILLPLTIALTLLVGIMQRRRLILLLAVLNLGLSLLSGTRAAALGGLLLFVLVLLAHASLLQRLNVGKALRLFPLVLAVLIVAIYLGDVRAGQYNILRTIANLGITLFYGNNFSDLRDFAWVKSYWDGQLYLGKTQLAGLLAFIPSAISPFRAEWNWGVITTTMTGLDPKVTPGLRAGAFGEMYFNFGWLGVLVAGVLFGYVIRRAHNAILTAARTLPSYEAQVKVLGGFVMVGLAGNLLNTAGFFGFYITLAVLTGLHALDYMLRAVRVSGEGGLDAGPVSHASPL